ncbi:MAG: nucleoside triphosphate pyrophosphohydrolase family protein [Anaeroplasmataceae bacterium]|nr:nucleoside triphosphate pyrophosphohydrolase family protein [Anaeroplasmataceae bacterium]
MEVNQYQELAMKTLNPSLDQKDILINAVMGLCGEAGEAIDLVKKHLYQGHKLDIHQFTKELGDVAWYLAEACTAVGIRLEDVFRKNIEKLKQRFPEGFSETASMERKDEGNE